MSVGDYVRTKNGEIGKITYISEYNTAITTDYATNQNISKCVGINNIIKSSPNIIDLIEVGDYVNGELVTAIHKDYVYDEISLGTALETACNYTATLNEDIKSIVTKEQFSQMEYKVGD